MDLEFANRLTQYRKKAGLSQEELADKLGVSRQAVSKWECGESSPDTDNLIALSKIYGVSLDELIYGKKESKEETKGKEPFVHIKGKDGEEVVINGGIHVTDEDGSEVHIDKDGVHIKDEETKEEVDLTLDVGCAHPRLRLFEIVFNAILPLLVVLAYLLLGFLLPNGDGWSKYWVLFFLIPILPSLLLAIKKKRFTVFAYPVLAAAVYLTVGMFMGIWHPTWVIFITIPIYYSAFGPIDTYLKHKHPRRAGVIIDAKPIEEEKDED